MEKEYLGTYPVRKISKKVQVINIPEGISGEYAIYRDNDENITLIKVGEKRRKE